MNVMVVDDNPEVGELLRMQLEAAGHLVVGPITTAPEALLALAYYEVHCAVLDVNLGIGSSIIPVADSLDERNIPFIFLTGYSEFYARGMPLGKRFKDHPLITKPYKHTELMEAVNEMSGRRP